MQLSRRQALSAVGACLSLQALATPSFSRRRARAGRARSEVERFLDAVRRGELEEVRRRLAADPSLARACDEVGRSAFVLAHLQGHVGVAERLREEGLELDLVEAVLAADWPRVDELAAADPGLLEAAHPVGGTPLYAGALVASTRLFHLRTLGCDPDAAPEGGTGFTPARGAMDCAELAWARFALADLCGNGADVNAPQRGGSSVLHGAVARRDAELVRLAIRKGARVEARDAEGRTAQALAAQLGWSEGEALLAAHERLPRDNRASRLALDANREPVEIPDLGDVPRELQQRVTGSSHTDLSTVRELVGRDRRLVYSLSADDELPIEASAHIGSKDIIRFHLDHGAPLSLPTAVSLGDLDSIASWLEEDPTLVHERGAHDMPLMYFVVFGGSLEAAELLVHYGVPVDQESKGATALHWSARRGEEDVARWLIENGAELEAVGTMWDRDGQTPLQVALARGDERMARILRDAGARG